MNPLPRYRPYCLGNMTASTDLAAIADDLSDGLNQRIVPPVKTCRRTVRKLTTTY